MRTKILVAAAVLAAGLATSMADNVYSLNVVGYVNQVYPAGFSMVATPLKTPNNTVGEVLADAPAGLQVYKFTGGVFQPVNTYFGSGFWGDNNQLLPPGQGYFIKSAAPWTNIFVGEVVTSNTNSLSTGFNMVGSAYPAQGAMDTALGLVPTAGDQVYAYNNGSAYAPVNTYFGSGFWGNGNPQLDVSQGVFYKAATNNNWVQNFTIP